MKTLEEKLNDRVPGLMLSQRQVLAKIINRALQKQRKEIVEMGDKMKFPETEKTKESIKYPTANPSKPEEAISQFLYNQAIKDYQTKINANPPSLEGWRKDKNMKREQREQLVGRKKKIENHQKKMARTIGKMCQDNGYCHLVEHIWFLLFPKDSQFIKDFHGVAKMGRNTISLEKSMDTFTKNKAGKAFNN